MHCWQDAWIGLRLCVSVILSDAGSYSEFLLRGGAGAKEENLRRRGRPGEEVGPGREDGSWRRDTGARSDGAWRKSKLGDEGVGMAKDDRAERQDRAAERDDRSTWRRSEQVRFV